MNPVKNKGLIEAGTRVLVTGCDGMLGGALVTRLLEVRPGATILGIDIHAPSRIKGVAADLSNPRAALSAIELLSPQVVFHCAGAVTAHEISELSAHILAPTNELVKALQAAAPTAVLVVPGAAAEYGTLPAGHPAFAETDDPTPVSPYGIVKLAQTGIALKAAEEGLDARVGRIFNLIGPGVVPTLMPGRVAENLASIAAGDAEPVIELPPLMGVRDYVDIRDACDGLIAVAEKGVFGRVYNICTGRAATVREAVEALVRCAGLEVTIAEERRGAARTDPDATVGDPARTARELKWSAAIDLETSARDEVAAAFTTATPF